MSKNNQQKAAQQKDVNNYKQALKKLHAHKGDSADDPTYLQLNKAANDAANKLPWWRR